MALAAAATFQQPALSAVQLVVEVAHIDDATLTSLLLMGQQLKKVYAESIRLCIDQHANKAWTWDTLGIAECDVASLARLPDPSGRETATTLRAGMLIFTSDVTSVSSMVHTDMHGSPRLMVASACHACVNHVCDL